MPFAPIKVLDASLSEIKDNADESWLVDGAPETFSDAEDNKLASTAVEETAGDDLNIDDADVGDGRMLELVDKLEHVDDTAGTAERLVLVDTDNDELLVRINIQNIDVAGDDTTTVQAGTLVYNRELSEI